MTLFLPHHAFIIESMNTAYCEREKEGRYCVPNVILLNIGMYQQFIYQMAKGGFTFNPNEPKFMNAHVRSSHQVLDNSIEVY